jgi:carboxyl-terminal processing protease
MRNRSFILTLFLFGQISLSFAQKTDPVKQQCILLKKAFEKNHYSPLPFDDKLSGNIFRSFIKSLDPRGVYFTVTEIEKLKAIRFSIDDDISGSGWSFLPETLNLYRLRLLETEKELDRLLLKPINFSIPESIVLTNSDTILFPLNNEESIKKWNRAIKYQALWQLLEEEEKKAKTFDQKKAEEQIRARVIQREKRAIRRILDASEGFEKHVGNLFLNAIATTFDPHSNYFSERDWEAFEKSLSTEGMSFGWTLKENEAGEVVIAALTPGGAAWKTNELHKGDKLLSVKLNGKNAIELSETDLEEVDDLLESSTEKLTVTVKKQDGIIKTVALKKELATIDENIVKSFILEGEKRIGYISLPGFYSEWENSSGHGCSNDVAREIVKLKKEKIDGLILDIRYNGGGALHEGSNLAGIFINEGPLFILQERDHKPQIMKDANRGTVYDGPLLVMINGQSASASEILGSTLQDFNRAVIVGSRSFGKATGQGIIPVDSTIQPVNSRLKGPIIKITEMKLYRITGKSIQQKGITPDIQFPDLYEAMNYKESSMTFSLPKDSIAKKVTFSKLPPLPLAPLAEKSKARLSLNHAFKAVDSLREVVGAFYNENTARTIPLKLDEFRKWNSEYNKLYKSFENIEAKENKAYKVENTKLDSEIMKVDGFTKENNDTLKDGLSKDIYLIESYFVINDLINLSIKN